MKTLEQVLETYESQTLDGRDMARLAKFVPYDKLSLIGVKLKDEVTEEEWNTMVVPFTKENVLEQLKDDVAFGFEKALGKRGISASLMYNVVSMWNWILEEGLENWSEYAYYGLPLFKATAVKYGFDNSIGEDKGSEEYYEDEN